jgi:membrane-bound serine protease (ClpP class)
LMVPGILGAISLLLALFSLSALPVNLVALLFVVLGAVMVVAEFFIVSHGLLSVGGVAFLAFGGVFLIDRTPEVPVGVSPAVVAVVCGGALVLTLLLAWLVVGDRSRHVHTGTEGLLGAKGKVTRAVPGGIQEGQVFVQGERWVACSEVPLGQDTRVVVEAVEDMVLTVRARDSKLDI